MADHAALRRLREQRFFAGWDEFVSPALIAESEATVRRLVDDLLALGPEPTEEAVRRAVDQCVRQFNALDDGWICTTDREEICEQIGRVVESCGFECEEDWLAERDW
jgi:hypothetical protein